MLTEVLITYTSYPISEDDWRARFMHDMVFALAARQDLRLRLWGPAGPIPGNARLVATTEERDSLSALLNRGGIAHLLRRPGWSTIRAVARLLRQLRSVYRRNRDVDVVHVNWLQNALALLGSRTPALVTVLGSDIRLLKLPGMAFLLRTVFRQRPCIVAPNAEWMVPILTRHFSRVAEIRTIPFGVDPRWFQVQRTGAMNKPRKWLAVFRLTREKIGPLFAWGASGFGPEDELHLFGPNQDDVALPEWVHYHGPADPQTLREHWFPQSAGLISLSRHDEGRPQVILEAMASGLPIIVSDLPAHVNLVRDGETGLVVKTEEHFLAALAHLSDPDTNTRIGAAARRWMRDGVGTWEDCAQRYADAYRDLLGPDA